MSVIAPAAGPQQVAVVDGSCMLTPADIGGKAWGVNRMRALGLAVPPAIVATTHACREYHATDRVVDAALWAEIVEHMRVLEVGTGRRFGAARRPLLVSVRSGAPQSMPGMMDTVLNLGINAAIEAALAAETGDARYAADTHRRFVEQYRKVVLGARPDPVPGDPWVQLRTAVASVFDSWHSPRAQIYRSQHGPSEDGCTAVMIQAMVFGNLDERSGTGVLFSRNPITGDAPAWGEWLTRAQVSHQARGTGCSTTMGCTRTMVCGFTGKPRRCLWLGRSNKPISMVVARVGLVAATRARFTSTHSYHESLA